MKDKEHRRLAGMLAPLVDRVAVVPLPSDRSEDPKIIARHPQWRRKVVSFADVTAGWRDVLKNGRQKTVLVTGSLYLVGALRATAKKG
jgi:folylpolyglutamate synthase/dihydropteroate synthase